MKKDMIIVYDDFSAMPLQVSFLNGDWWLTTPGERLQPLDDYLDDDNGYIFLCHAGGKVGVHSGTDPVVHFFEKYLGKCLEISEISCIFVG